MTLSIEQKQEAEKQYIRGKLSKADILVSDQVAHYKEIVVDAQKQIASIQESCAHPLIARTFVNNGYSGEYARDPGTYWTSHVCSLCERSWQTSQRWQYEGDGLGQPKKKS